MHSHLLILLMTAASLTAAEPANWPSWRGADSSGSVTQGNYPTKWDPTNVLWKVALPGKGCSTPIIWNQRLYLTAPIEGHDGVVAYDWAGKPLWQRKLGREEAGKHRNGSGSNPSPVTDGKSIFVYFKSGTLAALDMEGKVTWQTNLVAAFGPDDLYWDQGTSPVLTKDCVVFARMHGGDSWVAGFDRANGSLRWKVTRKYETPTEGDHAYTTPLVLNQGGKETLLVWGAQHLTAHDATDGKLIWSCGDFNPQKVAYWPSVASPVVAGEVAVVACGRADRNLPRLYGVRMGGSGDVTSTHKLWSRDDTGTFVPTPAQYKGKIYLIRDRGEVDCLDPLTGKTVWKDAFPRSSGNFYSSPVIANGILYGVREDGVMYVARIENGFELLSEIDMGERIIATPVALADRLFIRGDRHLYCVASQP